MLDKRFALPSLIVLMFGLSFIYAQAQGPASTAFTYQGQLVLNGAAVNDACDFSFTLWENQPGVGLLAGQQMVATNVNNGLFMVQLDFGVDVWTGGGQRFLEIAVRCPKDTGNFSNLGAVEITSVPYANYAHQASWDGLQNIPLGFADNTDDDTLSGLTCNNGEIIEWNGAAWVCGVDNISSNGAAGDITGVQAGIGLTGGGVQGDVTLNIDFAGPGTATTAARSDHDHDTRYYTETELNTDGGAQVHWNNLVQVPADVADGDDDTLAGLVCTDSQIIKRQGAAWVCAADETGGGGSAGWSLTGNAGTVPGQNFIGTVDNQSVEFRVNNTTALRIESGSNPQWNSPNIIAGHSSNQVAPNISGATISGGGLEEAGTLVPNQVNSSFGTIGGGVDNTTNGIGATINGGVTNTANSNYATVNGGLSNTATGDGATVGGGVGNEANGNYAIVAGGEANTARGDAATVSGGGNNVAGGVGATVSGGVDNTAQGRHSFAAGYRAKANHDGTFVWADDANVDFASTGPNQFIIRATGGVGIGVQNPSGTLHLNTPVGPPPNGVVAAENGLVFGVEAQAGYKWIQSYGGALALNSEGNNVGIGTTTPQSRLEVSGGDIRVTDGNFIDDGTRLNTPDYVFEPDYPLLSFDELRSFIEREKHLPNVPSADEVAANGLNVSQFQMRLLEKVEELTLYILAQEEVAQAQQVAIIDLQEQNGVLAKASQVSASQFPHNFLWLGLALFITLLNLIGMVFKNFSPDTLTSKSRRISHPPGEQNVRSET